MRKRLTAAVVILILLGGMAYLFYPTAADQAAGVRASRVIQKYRQTVNRMTGEQIQNRLDEAAAYNEKITEPKITDMFSGRETMTLHQYEAPLNTGDGVLGVVTIPGTGVTLPVYHESAEHRAAAELVHLQGTHLPSEKAGKRMLPSNPFTGCAPQRSAGEE